MKLITRLLFTLFFLVVMFMNVAVSEEVTSKTIDQKDLETYEQNIFNAPIIRLASFTKPSCQKDECLNKLLLGIGLHYNNEKDFTRSTSNAPYDITKFKFFFPFFENEQRINLDTASLEREDVSSLSQKIKNAISGKKTAVVLLDAHGIKKEAPYQDGGILIPSQSGCQNYQKALQKTSIEMNNYPDKNSEKYQELRQKYGMDYQKYSELLCHKRILPYQEYEASLRGPTLIHFNSMDPVHQMNRQKIGEQYALFDSFTFVDSALYQHNFYQLDHTQYIQTYVYSASSNYQSELSKYNSCTYDTDKNNQIQLNEIYHKLKPIFFTEGLKKGSFQEKSFDWNIISTRHQINNKKNMAELFTGNPGKYSDAYNKTSNSPGFSVVFNLPGCKIAAPELFDSTKQVLLDSPSFKQKTQTQLPTYDMSIKDENTFENLLISAKAQAIPIVGKQPIEQLTADKTKIKPDMESSSVTKITADQSKKVFIAKHGLTQTDSPTQSKLTELMYSKFKVAYKDDILGKIHGDEFLETARGVASRTGLSVDEIMLRTFGESGFDPFAVNKYNKKHFGLYQFGAAAAEHLGTTTQQILQMPPAQQLLLYEEYGKIFGNYQYSTHVLPVSASFSSESIFGVRDTAKDLHLVDERLLKEHRNIALAFYRQNHVMDLNGDGTITKAEVNQYGNGIRKNAYTQILNQELFYEKITSHFVFCNLNSCSRRTRNPKTRT